MASNYLPKFYMDSYFYDIFRVGYAENIGAFLGMGNSLADEHRFLLFTVLVSLLLAALFIYVVCAKNLDTLSIVAITLLLSGGGSNVYDRIVNDGAVIDFLNIGFGNVRTGVFNVADVAIMTAGLLLILSNLKSRESNQ
ncbi:lipoprotein signal peptidase [Vibrio maritimus]|uniref:Lipoprotein signal peptidase n=1 Tax=Vibrio maritimus TaxID=990268 RepID=A0A090T5V9_9VIBR|nr:lipoprotein signal peptidase [Vibrio maritimus]